MKLRVWLDSGANAHSNREQLLEFSELGVTPEEWEALEDDEKDELAKEVAWDRMEWGWEVVREE